MSTAPVDAPNETKPLMLFNDDLLEQLGWLEDEDNETEEDG